MTEDIRYHILFLVNQLRNEHGLQPLQLHEDESKNCRAHAEWMAEESERTGDWRPRHSQVDAGQWNETVHHNYGFHEPYEAVELLIHDMDSNHLREVLNAKQFVAADVSYRRPKNLRHVFLCMRFK